MANTVEIIIKAIDQASGNIGKATTSLDKFKAGFKSLTGFSLTAAGGIAAAGMAIQKVVDFTKQAVTETVAYVSSIKDMSRVLGLNTEETSRLVQASDDLFITQDKLKTALLAASRQGVDVSIDGLKRLSDEYLVLTPGLERTQFLLQTFGRSGADMGKLMEVGANGIDKAMSAISDSLVVTEAGAAATIKYMQSVDNLKDSFDGIKYVVGQEVMPVLTDLNVIMTHYVEKATDGASGTKKFEKSLLMLNPVLYENYKFIQWIGGLIGDWADEISGADPVMQAWSDRLQGLADEYYRLHPEIVKVTEDFSNLASSMMNVAGMQSSFEDSITDLNEQLEQTKIDMLAAGSTKFLSEKDAKKVEGYRKALTSVWLQIKEITDLQEIDLSDAMGMTGGELIDTGFTEQQIQDIADLRKELGYFEGELTSLGTVAYVKQSQLDDLDGLEQKFADIEAQIGEVKAAHELATKQIVYDNILAGLSAEGLTSGEFAMAQEYAVGLGLITQNDADLAIALQVISEAIPTQTGLLGEFNTAVSLGDEYIIALSEHIQGMVSEKYIDIYIRTHGVPPTGPTSPQTPNHFSDQWIDPNERAGGGPVWGATPYVVGEKGPELFVPEQNGTIVPNKNLGGNSVVFYGDAYLEIKEDLKDDILSQLRLTT